MFGYYRHFHTLFVLLIIFLFNSDQNQSILLHKLMCWWPSWGIISYLLFQALFWLFNLLIICYCILFCSLWPYFCIEKDEIFPLANSTCLFYVLTYKRKSGFKISGRLTISPTDKIYISLESLRAGPQIDMQKRLPCV